MVGTSGVNTVFIGDNLPELGTDLVAALATAGRFRKCATMMQRFCMILHDEKSSAYIIGHSLVVKVLDIPLNVNQLTHFVVFSKDLEEGLLTAM